MVKKRLNKLYSKRFKGVAKKVKKASSQTKEQAGEKLKSATDQMVGSKDHGIERPEAPRITNETVAEHREAVLAEAKKFKYPLHSQARVVIISTSIILGVLSVIFILTAMLLYGIKSTGSFAYSISKFVPYPVARVDGDFVSFENYLFEVQHSLFYLRNHGQEGIDIDSKEGESLVKSTKERALEKVQIDKLASKLLKKADLKVTKEEIAEQITQFELRGGIDETEGTLKSVLKKYYNWELKDLDRVIKTQLTYQKLLPTVDKEAKTRVDTVQRSLDRGTKFKDAVKKYSEDPISKQLDGFVGEIDKDVNVWPANVVDAVFALKKGQLSEVLTTGQGYHIFRLDEVKNENTVAVSQIFIAFFDLEQYLIEQLNTVDHKAYIAL